MSRRQLINNVQGAGPHHTYVLLQFVCQIYFPQRNYLNKRIASQRDGIMMRLSGGGHSCFWDSDEARLRFKRKFWDKAVEIDDLYGKDGAWWGIKGYMRDNFNHSNKVTSHKEHFQNSRLMKSVLDMYCELRPFILNTPNKVWPNTCSWPNHWRWSLHLVSKPREIGRLSVQLLHVDGICVYIRFNVEQIQYLKVFCVELVLLLANCW
jgi:hypothetical protein